MSKKFLKYIIVVSIIFFLIKSLYSNWNQLSTYNWKPNLLLLSLSFIFALIHLLAMAWCWRRILIKIGGSLSIRKGLQIYFSSQLGRYIPGKVWVVLGRVSSCNQEGISKIKTTASIVYEVVISIFAASLFFIMSIPFWEFNKISNKIGIYYIIIPFCLFILIHPKIFNKGVNIVLKQLRKEPIKISMPYRDILEILLLDIIFWAFLGVAFYLFINSTYTLSINKAPIVAGIFSISWVIGFLSFLTPGGIGVREGVLTFLLSYQMPVAMAVFIAILSRVWLTIAELVCLGITHKFK